MSRFSYVNGKYCEHRDSFVHIEDRGYQFADGVYEVFAVINEKIVDFDVTNGMIIDHEDEFFGETKIIRNILEISSIEEIETNLIEIAYQGCSDRGFCYPVQNKNIK